MITHVRGPKMYRDLTGQGKPVRMREHKADRSTPRRVVVISQGTDAGTEVVSRCSTRSVWYWRPAVALVRRFS
jgi:hypothetical protein